MSLNEMKKEDFELLSYKDITNLILTESGKMNTKDLFKKITDLLELPSSVFENKIADYYTSLTNDKRFILLADGNWDLRSRHTSDKVAVIVDDDDEEEEETGEIVEEEEEEPSAYDSTASDEYDDTEDELQDLVVVDEDELELEQ